MAWSVMEATDVRIEEVALGRRQDQGVSRPSVLHGLNRRCDAYDAFPLTLPVYGGHFWRHVEDENE